jgi:hypothetical protein
MSYEYYTIVKASSGFWEKLLMKQINKEAPFQISNIKSDEIVINSTNRTALEEIKNLSKEYPEEVFRVKVAGEDVYENFVSLYEYFKGESKLVKEGLEYCFGIKTEDRDKLKKGLFNKFQKKVADYYQRIEQPKVNHELFFDEDQKEQEDDNDNFSVIIQYKTKKLCITAKKFGATYIDVNVEFLDKTEKLKSPERESPSDYDDIPF